MFFDKIISLLMCIATLLSVCVSAWTVSQSRKSQLTETYYSNMAKAYAAYLNSISEFIYRPSAEAKIALACALYTVQLYASEKVVEPAQEAYQKAIDYARLHPDNALEVDTAVNHLGLLMRQDLDQFRRQGNR